jgi:hypothetical protein
MSIYAIRESITASTHVFFANTIICCLAIRCADLLREYKMSLYSLHAPRFLVFESRILGWSAHVRLEIRELPLELSKVLLTCLGLLLGAREREVELLLPGFARLHLPHACVCVYVCGASIW